MPFLLEVSACNLELILKDMMIETALNVLKVTLEGL